MHWSLAPGRDVVCRQFLPFFLPGPSVLVHLVLVCKPLPVFCHDRVDFSKHSSRWFLVARAFSSRCVSRGPGADIRLSWWDARPSSSVAVLMPTMPQVSPFCPLKSIFSCFLSTHRADRSSWRDSFCLNSAPQRRVFPRPERSEQSEVRGRARRTVRTRRMSPAHSCRLHAWHRQVGQVGRRSVE